MARLGLGERWRCLLANDIDPMKCGAYRTNFGDSDLIEKSIADLTVAELPDTRADLAWASFPCQDLSLAGARKGIKSERSGLFFEFWRLMKELHAQERAPRLVVLENVAGLISSNDGADFAAIVDTLEAAGYRVGATIIDAAHFTPQSRPRLFIVGFSPGASSPQQTQHNENTFLGSLKKSMAGKLIALPSPAPRRNTSLENMIDWDKSAWRKTMDAAKLVAMMSPLQRARFDAIRKTRERRVGAGFRRNRRVNGETVQRFEVRFDGLAGCLRTPAGGSSRQIVIAVENGNVRARLINPREAARLMGMPEDYKLPDRANAGLKICGDGVCVPAVQWLAEEILEPALRRRKGLAA